MTNPTIAEMMRVYAEDAVARAREYFAIELDYSEQSLEDVERILSALHVTLPKGLLSRVLRRRPTEDQIKHVAAIWGAYVGEVIRRRWGGEWTDETAPQAGHVLTLRVGAADIYPAEKAYKRLIIGPEENVWHYYQILRRDFEGATPDGDDDRLR